MLERDMDAAILTLAEDEVTGMLETRQTLDIGSKEYTLLTNAVDKSEQKLNEAYKVIYSHQEKLKELEELAKFRQKELEQKDQQHKAELELKEKQYQAELMTRQMEINQRDAQFKAELEQKERLHQIEMKQKDRENKIRCKWTFIGVGVTAGLAFTTAIVTKRMDFANYEHWMPIITEFEKDDHFSYEAGKLMSKAILRQ